MSTAAIEGIDTNATVIFRGLRQTQSVGGHQIYRGVIIEQSQRLARTSRV